MSSLEKDSMKLYEQLKNYDVSESARLQTSLEDFASMGLNQTN